MATKAPVLWPARNPRVTEEAGTRGGTHSGIDLAANLNDPVLAPFDGTVVYAGGDGARAPLWLGNGWLYPNGEGRTVDIQRADGLISRCGHLNGYAVKQGDRVTAGQTVGYAGDSGYSTGVHIHWELRWDRAWVGGSWINPRSVNPQTFDGGSSSATTTRKKTMATLYCSTANDKRPGKGGTGIKYYLAGDSPGTDANWLPITDVTLATELARVHGNAVWLGKATCADWEKKYRSKVRTV